VIAKSTVREMFELVIFKAAQRRNKRIWERTFCIMGQQVSIRCETRKVEEKPILKEWEVSNIRPED